jgi:PAS domain S-box-containing protein
MAEGFAKYINQSGIEAFSAGTETADVHPMAISVMKEMGVDISNHYSKTIQEIEKNYFDLIITLCDSVKNNCPVFPGAPAIVHWSIEDPSIFTGNEEETREKFKKVALEIKELVNNLLNRGYLDAFIQQKNNLENILNCLSEGIIAHDLNRKLFFFSRGAEKITGFRESDVIGKDCYDIFTPSLCGKNCSFCEGDIISPFNNRHYNTVTLSSEGVRKEIGVSIIPLRDSMNKLIGVVVSLTDNTEVKDMKRKLGSESNFRGIIGQDHKMQHLYELIKDLSQCDFPVAISGESGTGKELVALAIHEESARKDKLFVPINCGALPEGTLESELFGHVKGAFTGAIRDKKGRFELADGGTIFLDEVAELSQPIQVKLLRVLQEGTFEPVGSEKTKKVNVRIISATNKNLRELTRKGTFREDLFYRLAVVPIELPPLRDRRNDIPFLVEYFLKNIISKLNREKMTVSKEALSVLMSFSWPGNIRQLQNAIQYTMIKCHGTTIQPEHLPPEINGSISSFAITHVHAGQPGKVGRKPKLNEESVGMALEKTGGNKAKAARILGVGRATLYNFLKDNESILKSYDIS